MNRLSPLIVRAVGRQAPALAREPSPDAIEGARAILDDLRLFATGWFGGLVFFGTLLG